MSSLKKMFKKSPTEVWSTLLMIFARFCSFDSNIPVDSFSIILTFPSLNPALKVVRFWIQASEHELLNGSLSTCMLVQNPPLKISYAIIYVDICFFSLNYLFLYITYQNRITATTSAFFVNIQSKVSIGLATHIAYNFVYSILCHANASL